MERVTKAFFEDYKEVFFKLRTELQKQMIPSKESHEFTLQLLNRIMFIYFISKKDWLEEPKFVDWLWLKYRELGKYNSDEFYEKWLKPVFLKAFNNRGNEIEGLPGEVVRVISNAPYLNGGLFKENDLDNIKILIKDKIFEDILKFFESYNFTIKEDMPLESEVAVDPQMIGYVYESLAKVAENVYEPDVDLRTDWGIFYTARTEVYFMCRRSLVEYLSKNLPELPKDKFYHIIFDPAEEREKIEEWFTKNENWRKLDDLLNNLSVVDPACGSGAFLVGMLNVVSELYRMIYKHTGNNLSDFALKNRVIQYSLYGVDVMPWAIHAAELRLWLQLIVETEFKKEELRQHPLLPNLNLNLRVGDSIVQEIGGITFNLRTNNLKDHLKKKLEALKQEKRKYFENSPNAKFKTPEEVKNEEIRLFEEIIDERIEGLATDIQIFEHNIKMAESQKTLSGEQVIDEKKVKENQIRIDANNEEVEKLNNVKSHLIDPEKKPFVWDIDFAEIFGDKGGFDIVIGNPPYVRHGLIFPPNRPKSGVSEDDKRKYKEKLARSVKSRFPVVSSIDIKSDYYVYFYFHGLSLLNDKGTFSFITSNSWLDVGYGGKLQDFLCKYVPIISIYDNPKRSFAHADVNTIIALFGPPWVKQIDLSDWKPSTNKEIGKTWPHLRNVAKFVMFKKPFEEVLSSRNLIEIDNIKVIKRGEEITQLVGNVVETDSYRCFPIIQEDLLEDGWEYPENYKNGRFKEGNYGGNNWGGKYLRAPNILFSILQKGDFRDLQTLGKIGTYLNTGGADKFYFVKVKQRNNDTSIVLNTEFEEEFEVENRFLQPIIKSSQELSRILIEDRDVKSFIISIPDNEKISGLKINDYIQYGVKKKYNRRSGPSKRIPWWKLPEQARFCPEILFPRNYNDMLGVFYNPERFIANRFYRLETSKHSSLIIYLNSTLNFLMFELFGRRNLGLGALDIEKPELRKLPVLEKDINFKNSNFLKRKIETIYDELGFNRSMPIREQEPNPLPDRAELDNIIFDEIGLTQDERKEVYWSVCELVKQRIDKAKSLRD